MAKYHKLWKPFIGLFNSGKTKLTIYKDDLRTKGFFWSIVHRTYKYPSLREMLAPFLNLFKPEYVSIQGFKIYIDKNDHVLSEELLINKTWEAYETAQFKKNIKAGDTVVDLGAHIGYYTLLAAKCVGKQGKVYAFEPDPHNFSLLKKNITVNGFQNVILVNKAVSDANRKTKLYLSERNKGDHRLYNSNDKRKSITVDTITLDSYFKQLDNPSIDLIKIDIQGSEMKAIQGSEKILKENKHLIIFTELSPIGFQLIGASASEYLSLLVKNKFSIHEINEKNKTTKPIKMNELLEKYTPELQNNANLLCIK
jgi:FkbM family methyltransferase